MDSISAFARYPWKSDVFLSFEEKDTKSYLFARFLYKSLRKHGVKTFTNCGGGERVSGKEEIEVSRISVVVFSENYASSPRCLDELVKIIECNELKQQIVYPVFYDVNSSDVRHQKGRFGFALFNNEIEFKNSTEKMGRWRSALTAAAKLSGWDVSNYRYDADCIDAIVDQIRRVHSQLLEEKAGHVVVQVENEADESLPEHLKGLFMYSCLFPSDYEFRKDELVQLWIAEGFIQENYKERMENTGIAFFNWLEDKRFFVRSRCDFRVDFDSVCSVPIYNPTNFLYKVNAVKLSVLGEMILQGNYFRAVDGKLDGVSENTQHLSLICEDIDEMTLEVLQKYKHLSTLLFISGCRSSIKHVPRNFFSSLKFLRTLNLSGTLISELPSSIRVVKTLRYLDVSETPITRFPESIDSLRNLQTIKLRGCVHFVQLPKGMKNLINLRHIELDIIRQLDSLPAFLGNLTNLQTLSAFLVERDDGCRIEELKNLNHLKGAVCISRLENVMTTEEATEASLSEKTCLQSLELRWSNLLDENAEEQERILESLQPHYGLQELEIQNYGGSMLPSWISDPSFADLVVVTLYRCKNCKLLPSIGQLPALKFLSIIEMNEVKEINHHFFGRKLPAFPKLERLEVDTMLKLKEWQVCNGDLPSLLRLTVDSCPELVTFPSLSVLKSLRHLELRRCPKLLDLPRYGLTRSLESIIIKDCSELKEWFKNEGFYDWSGIWDVASVWLDDEQMLNPDELEFQSI